ncbi:hypothetical protein GCM10010330_56760 [Streptomyces tendae]|uniref:hypothetical protein n=1 Tax=Streptomyces tendae TaxID=1932 RepID=UPI00167C40DA|nr:hypothetical protein [Streptomyces tendae]GHA95257.1 hypothetical protein GCM10010330_56760 [Streptomyces tendae]
MTERPYTDTDLRAEAARQHATLTEDPDFMGVGEQMEAAWVPSVETTEDGSGRTWKQLLVVEDETGDDEDYAAYDEAQRKIHALIRGAADVSEWAVNLGADGLEPSTEHEITLNAGRPIARIHFAFEPSMPEEMRTDLVEGIGDAINEAGADREDDAEGEPADSDSDVFDLISEIASRLRDATDSGEYHAVGLIYDLAMSRTTVAEARAELADIEFGHV